MATVVINGKRISVQGNNISVINNRVYVDGKEVTDSPLSGIVEIKWEGPLANLTSDASVSCGLSHCARVLGEVLDGRPIAECYREDDEAAQQAPADDGITVAEILKYCQSQRHSPDTILAQCCCGTCKVANLIKCAQKDAERRRKP